MIDTNFSPVSQRFKEVIIALRKISDRRCAAKRYEKSVTVQNAIISIINCSSKNRQKERFDFSVTLEDI